MTFPESQDFEVSTPPTSDGTGRDWFKIIVAAALVIALGLGGFAVWSTQNLNDQVTDVEGQVAATSLYDGEYDFSDALVDAGTAELVRGSIREAVFRYADAEGEYLGSYVVTAIVVSDEYVLVPAFVIQVADDPNVQILVAGMRSSLLDADVTAEEFDLSVQPLVHLDFGLAAIRRPATTTINASSILDSLGDVREVQIDTTLIVAGTVALNTTSPNEVGRQVMKLGKVDIISGTRIYVVGLPEFQPVYALRDGVPEFIGVSIGGSGGITPVITIYELESLLSQLGISVEFPE